MELLTPIDDLSRWPEVLAKQPGESCQPQQLDDQPQRIASMVGRQNVSYDPVWAATERAYPNWQPVRCESMRRAILLASSATQHRTKMFEVHRKGRLVCLRLVPVREDAAPTRLDAIA